MVFFRRLGFQQRTWLGTWETWEKNLDIPLLLADFWVHVILSLLLSFRLVTSIFRKKKVRSTRFFAVGFWGPWTGIDFNSQHHLKPLACCEMLWDRKGSPSPLVGGWNWLSISIWTLIALNSYKWYYDVLRHIIQPSTIFIEWVSQLFAFVILLFINMVLYPKYDSCNLVSTVKRATSDELRSPIQFRRRFIGAHCRTGDVNYLGVNPS